MGQGTAQAVREIEGIRERLESDLGELEGRLPRPAVWAKRLAGVAVGGGLGGVAFWRIVSRVRRRRAGGGSEPPPPAQEARSGQAAPLLVAGALVLLVQARELRRVNRALVEALRRT